MEIKLMPQADDDLAYWKATGNKQIMKRITKLLDDILKPTQLNTLPKGIYIVNGKKVYIK